MNTQTWLIAYDIRDPRRLATVHRAVRKQALAVQYSVFVGRFTRRGLRHMVATINSIIAPQDDVRLYPLPHRPDWVFYGRSRLPEAVYLLEHGLAALAPPPESLRSPHHRQPPSQLTDMKGGNRPS